MPWIDNLLHREPGLYLSEGAPVAVVIMPHIVMPQNNRADPFVWRAEVFLVPVANDSLAIRVQRRDQHDDGVLQNSANAGCGPCRQLVRNLCSALGTGNLCRV